MSTVPRFQAIRVVFAALLAAGCTFATGVEFSPIESEGGAAGAAGSSNGGAGGAITTTLSGGSEPGGTIAILVGNAGTGDRAGAGGADPNRGHFGGAGNGGAGGAGGSTPLLACSGVQAWNERSYAMGDKATAVCKAPYNGLCVAGVQHEFECRPAAGVVGLAWCRVREPGVVNGWEEAWVLHTRCDE
jgi:hypothetical protein